MAQSEESPVTNLGIGSLIGRQPTADSRQPTADSRQPTADSRQPTADSRQPWLTFATERSVLVVVRTATALSKLLDVVAVTASDRRVHTYFTVDETHPARFGAGLRAYLQGLDALVVPWDEAVSRQFDLVVTASENDGLDQLEAPILVVPHGLGFEKYYPGGEVIAGMDPRRLVVRGRVVPAAIALSHPRQQELLQAACPAAAARSVVIGDPTLDRMLVSRRRAASFRAALGARGKSLVVIASTWGPDSLLGRWPDLPDRLVAALPADEYGVVVVMHPGVWAVHGPWQVRAWLSRASEAGLRVVGPDEDWQAALVGASCVLSDHGSMALHAAALDTPLLLAPGGSAVTVAGSATEALRGRAGVLEADGDLHAQVAVACRDHVAGRFGAVTRLAVDGPGRCAERLRPLLYGLMRLSEAGQGEPVLPPVSLQASRPATVAAMVVGAQAHSGEVAVARFPDLWAVPAREGLDFRHLIADAELATLAQVAGAAILSVAALGAGWPQTACALLEQWPRATIVACSVDENTCLVRTRGWQVAARADLACAGIDPLVLASLVYVRMCQGRESGSGWRDRLRIGERLIEVVVGAG